MHSQQMLVLNIEFHLFLDKIIDNDDKYDTQSYMRTINTTDVALFDNFKYSNLINKLSNLVRDLFISVG